MSFLQKMEARKWKLAHIFYQTLQPLKVVYESTCYTNRILKSSRLKEDNF
jgi:hypothetical protein